MEATIQSLRSRVEELRQHAADVHELSERIRARQALGKGVTEKLSQLEGVLQGLDAAGERWDAQLLTQMERDTRAQAQAVRSRK